MEYCSYALILLILLICHNLESFVIVPRLTRYNASKQWKLSELRYNYIYEIIPFSKNETSDIVRIHNEFRSNVNPSASAMKFVEWNNNLVKYATESIDRCAISKQSNPSNLGENIMFIEGENFSPVLFLSAWKNHYERFNYSKEFCPDGYRCDSYFQMISADVTGVGCARKQCDDFVGVSCFYNLKVNNALSPYKAGEPCTSCHYDYQFCHNNLCMTKLQCDSMDVECECILECKNGYDLDKAECKCICEEGDNTTDCSNSSHRCSLQCRHGYVLNKEECRCTCGEDNTKDCSDSLYKCNKHCDRGYVLDDIKCLCICYSGHCEAYGGHTQQLVSTAAPMATVLTLNIICHFLALNLNILENNG